MLESDEFNLKRTECLGVCKPGHVMGVADESFGVYLFNDMASEQEVQDLVNFSREALDSPEPVMSENLKSRLEKRFDAGAIRKIPWRS